MNQPCPIADKLFSDTKDAVQPPARMTTRSGVAGADLQTLILWNVVIAGVLHIGCGIVAHLAWEWIKTRLDQLEQTIKGVRSGSVDPKQIEGVLQSVKEDLEKVPEALAATPIEPSPSSLEAAKDKIRKILEDTGWPVPDPEARAASVVDSLVSSMKECAKGASRPTLSAQQEVLAEQGTEKRLNVDRP